MLNERDLEFIRLNREQITHLRTIPLTLIHESATGAVDPFTGEATIEQSEEAAEATWSNLTSGGPGSDDIVMVGGVVAEAGDAIANFDISYTLDDVSHVLKDGERWRVRSKDEVGLGEINRHYVLLKRVT